ncbi:type Z 30S ribosomal protein S14 [Candidatus Berkelbacteria bacterium CG08_land_8_20_14_0_20_39_8]|uniref:Small ribosomal subunit protein uS14 n=1 Tax=Candidatus Berkelbacteria bacterium CG08_land_8_20_14_0_20_39_8 TaxID=1974511 RepID=A0A2M6YC59_9BACT|nr:MAG: type Z 30S ribosomal protein S14 [Candidatus Berkelbacteria bacterium CG08_land_8_20_14_0_20_39_8]
MAKKSQIVRSKRKPKFSSRIVRRCRVCGRRRGYYRKFQICRICLRELVGRGEVPGVTKSSW